MQPFSAFPQSDIKSQSSKDFVISFHGNANFSVKKIKQGINFSEIQGTFSHAIVTIGEHYYGYDQFSIHMLDHKYITMKAAVFNNECKWIDGVTMRFELKNYSHHLSKYIPEADSTFEMKCADYKLHIPKLISLISGIDVYQPRQWIPHIYFQKKKKVKKKKYINIYYFVSPLSC